MWDRGSFSFIMGILSFFQYCLLMVVLLAYFYVWHISKKANGKRQKTPEVTLHSSHMSIFFCFLWGLGSDLWSRLRYVSVVVYMICWIVSPFRKEKLCGLQYLLSCLANMCIPKEEMMSLGTARASILMVGCMYSSCRRSHLRITTQPFWASVFVSLPRGPYQANG